VPQLPLVDHHVHGVVSADLDRNEIEAMLSEAASASPAGTTAFDTQLGFAVRRWCAPVLGLEPHALAEVYVRRRHELGGTEVCRRFLTAAQVDAWLVDTGYESNAVTPPFELAQLSGAPAGEVTRLEPLAERLARAGGTASGFGDDLSTAIHEAAAKSVGFKSIAAYRGGLAFDPGPPSAAEVQAAADRWLREIGLGAPTRLEERVLIRHGIWAALDTGKPLQLHTGYGDADSRLHLADPSLLHDFLAVSETTGTPIMLLHCYPYHRQAGALANLFSHVYMDVGEALNHVGARSTAILAEALELTPFHKMLYSSDAFGLPELHYLGAVCFRRDIRKVTSAFVADGAWSAADAARVSEMIGSANARRVYRLDAGA